MRKFEDDLTAIMVSERPACDFCGDLAYFDAKTNEGPWAYLCCWHFLATTSQKLGLGYGQQLVMPGDSCPRNSSCTKAWLQEEGLKQ